MKLNKTKKLKATALERLSYCWGECVAIIFIAAGIFIAALLLYVAAVQLFFLLGYIPCGLPEIIKESPAKLRIITGVYFLAVYTFVSPLKYGINWFCYQTVSGKNIPASCFFSCYMHRRHFFRTIMLNMLVLMLRAVSFIPLHAVGVTEFHIIKQIAAGTADVTHIIGAALLSLLYMAAAAIFFSVSIGCMFVPYVYAAYPEAGVKRVFAESLRCLRGNIPYILRTLFSFMNWFAASLFIFPLVYAAPYFLMTVSALARDIIRSNRKGVTDEDEPEKEDAALA